MYIKIGTNDSLLCSVMKTSFKLFQKLQSHLLPWKQRCGPGVKITKDSWAMEMKLIGQCIRICTLEILFAISIR